MDILRFIGLLKKGHEGIARSLITYGADTSLLLSEMQLHLIHIASAKGLLDILTNNTRKESRIT